MGATELVDNDQRGPLLTDSSEDDQELRKRDNINISFNASEYEDDDDADKRSLRAMSERLKLESISVLYSKSFYPTSLGIFAEDEE